ncbi:MAG: AtpZ/AtpI family protein [Deltaproteobacteria bacterium]|nr:AtpZ/AtpI family protein [Deltaproteobacteria bacterium]
MGESQKQGKKTPLKTTENQNKTDLKAFAALSTMGIAMVLTTLLGLLTGYYFDKWFGTTPLFLIVFLILGIIAGFKNLFVTVKRYGLDTDTKDVLEDGSEHSKSGEEEKEDK